MLYYPHKSSLKSNINADFAKNSNLKWTIFKHIYYK